MLGSCSLHPHEYVVAHGLIHDMIGNRENELMRGIITVQGMAQTGVHIRAQILDIAVGIGN